MSVHGPNRMYYPMGEASQSPPQSMHKHRFACGGGGGDKQTAQKKNSPLSVGLPCQTANNKIFASGRISGKKWTLRNTRTHTHTHTHTERERERGVHTHTHTHTHACTHARTRARNDAYLLCSKIRHSDHT